MNLHEHSHPKICEAIYEQAKNLEHVIFSGFTHEPAVLLCEKLQTILPQSLTRFFFSDNGSTAVEVALKMVHQYWFNQGETQRSLYLSFDGGYHSDTFGAMSVGKHCHFHDPFQNLLFDVISIPFPSTWYEDDHVLEKEKEALKCLGEQLEKQGHKISAIIVEPLVQGAGGMRMCRPEFIKEVVKLVKSYDILVVYDEVMTGFGRLGTYFATEQIGIDPDFMCVSKGITRGFLPLALTITKEHIYDAFLSDQWDKAFAHGHSYTANPIACGAALASFELLVSEQTKVAMAQIEQAHQKGLLFLQNQHPGLIARPRHRGTVAAFELMTKHHARDDLKLACARRGLLIRPLGRTVYMLPPYSVTVEEMEYAYHTVAELVGQIGQED